MTDLDRIHHRLATLLEQAEKIVGPNYTLTLMARCHNEEFADADIVLTREGNVKLAIQALIGLRTGEPPSTAALPIELDCAHCGNIAFSSIVVFDGDGGGKCRECGWPGQVAIEENGTSTWMEHQDAADSDDKTFCHDKDCTECYGPWTVPPPPRDDPWPDGEDPTGQWIRDNLPTKCDGCGTHVHPGEEFWSGDDVSYCKDCKANRDAPVGA